MTNAEILASIEKMLNRVQVICGAREERMDGLVGQTVQAVYLLLVKQWNMPEDIAFFVGGNPVQPEFILRNVDVLEFIPRAVGWKKH